MRLIDLEDALRTARDRGANDATSVSLWIQHRTDGMADMYIVDNVISDQEGVHFLSDWDAVVEVSTLSETETISILDALSNIITTLAADLKQSEAVTFGRIAKDAFASVPIIIEIRALRDRYSATTVQDAVRVLSTSTRYSGSSKRTAR